MPGTSFFHQARNNAWSNHRLFDVCQKLTKHELNTKRAPFSPHDSGIPEPRIDG